MCASSLSIIIQLKKTSANEISVHVSLIVPASVLIVLTRVYNVIVIRTVRHMHVVTCSLKYLHVIAADSECALQYGALLILYKNGHC